jgi:4-amino-4-deoxy-L-arabinose transferase-like glycosyltransferase
MLSALHATLYTHFPSVGLVEWGRILSIVASAVSVLFLYLIMRQVSSRLAASVTALVYAAVPYNLFYGRVVLPEPWLVATSLISLYFFILYWNTGKFSRWLVSLLALTLSNLLKPTALIILVPMAFYGLANRRSLKFYVSSFVLAVLSVLPVGWWRIWMKQFPSGIPASSWLFNGNGIRFKGAWFHWLFGDRMGRLILGYWGLIPFGIGLTALGKRKNETMIVSGMVLGAFAYMAIIATGNVQHDYYQIQIIPALAMTVGIGFDYAVSLKKSLAKMIMFTFMSAILALSASLAWYEVRGYFNINVPAIVAAGREIDKITPADAKVIAPYQGDTAFLFQTNRTGWPIGSNIELDIKAGATYYVTTTRDKEYEELKAKYTLVEETGEYSIIKLSKPVVSKVEP